MTLFECSLIGSALSLVAMMVGFVWLGMRGELSESRMDHDEAADFVQRGAMFSRKIMVGIKRTAEALRR